MSRTHKAPHFDRPKNQLLDSPGAPPRAFAALFVSCALGLPTLLHSLVIELRRLVGCSTSVVRKPLTKTLCDHASQSIFFGLSKWGASCVLDMCLLELRTASQPVPVPEQTVPDHQLAPSSPKCINLFALSVECPHQV